MPGSASARGRGAAKPVMYKSYPSAKKGKERLLRKLATMKASKPKSMKSMESVMKKCMKLKQPRPSKDQVPYVPKRQMVDDHNKARLANQKWCMSFSKLASMTELETINHLTKVGILEKRKVCPACGHGSLTGLTKDRMRGWVQRCRSRRCHKFILPHAFHPIFNVPWGKNHISLNSQAQILFCLVSGVEASKAHILTGSSHKAVDNLLMRWLGTVSAFVEHEQSKIRLGGADEWTECEADEVTIRGKKDQSGKKVTWHQYCGILRRGDRRSLILHRMHSRTTSVKIHGKGMGSRVSPGPITKVEWKKIANRYLKNQKVLLHTDGARAYRFEKIAGVITDFVKHKRPRPVYSALWCHSLPRDQKKAHALAKHKGEVDKVWVKKGTQIIDCVWKLLRKNGVPQNVKADASPIDRRVREWQWRHWNAEVDKWAALGPICTYSFQRLC